ncbi:MAG: ornithine--oxo-acid transaminase [Candidatus Aminicenantes bacterium]|nr:ornithine--oxo-acid transaminase [Candidatus Aminicenantes bacterium]
MYTSEELIKIDEQYGAHNYHPLPIVIAKGEGVWVWDVEGNKYMDMLSAYSALNQGHRHPRIVKVAHEQLDRLTLTSRAFYNDKLPLFLKKVAEITGMEMVLPMNTGAEAVETALKAARKWGYYVKGVEKDKAEIIVAENNFHGRTITIISFSTEPQYRDGFGPFTPGFKVVPYGDARTIEEAITPNTVAVLIEPIQGEGGIIIPPDGYLKRVREITAREKVLFILDEIQTGLGRTGRMFAWEWEGAKPDGIILGKALSGGILPVSAFASSKEVLGVFNPGDHGSTFGGNPLGAAVTIEALNVLIEENLPAKANELGNYFMEQLKKLKNPDIVEVRGRGLLIGVELKKPAREYAEKLKEEGLLCKETHEYVIRFAPPLVITREEIDWAMERIRKVMG